VTSLAAAGLDLRRGRVEMAHGGGGRTMSRLIEAMFVDALGNEYLRQRGDAARLEAVDGRLVMSTDSHVVSPVFFPGGDIGSLAVHGTVNDVAVAGARPLWLSAAFILEEGFPLADLRRVVASMAEAARAAGVPVVTGDTKVVERGHGDGVFITTTGVGVALAGVEIAAARVRPGDSVLVSGTMGDHGVAIMSARAELGLETEVVSDTAAVHGLVAAMAAVAPGAIRWMRDPTRGGLAAALNELARDAEVGVALDEPSVPVRPQVEAACELLGLDPLYMACEGRLVAVCAPDAADDLLAAMRSHPLGAAAARIGEVTGDALRLVTMRTGFGGTRVVDWLSGEQLPRIC